MELFEPLIAAYNVLLSFLNSALSVVEAVVRPFVELTERFNNIFGESE